MPSLKTAVIQYLFESKYLAEGRGLMMLNDIIEAIEYCNKIAGSPKDRLSTNNPANFFKDFIRGSQSSNNWPDVAKKKRITGRQVTGDSQVFEFVPYVKGQKEPFLDLYKPDPDTETTLIQTVSLSRASKKLGRKDESWLIQTAINLNVIEQHLATKSAINVTEVRHLQISVKLKKTEIDTLYLVYYFEEENGQKVEKTALATCEAKQEKDPILSDQIVRQVQAAFSESLEIDSVIPLAIKSIKKMGIYVVEFEKVAREESEFLNELTFANAAIYSLVPPVKGINA